MNKNYPLWLCRNKSGETRYNFFSGIVGAVYNEEDGEWIEHEDYGEFLFSLSPKDFENYFGQNLEPLAPVDGNVKITIQLNIECYLGNKKLQKEKKIEKHNIPEVKEWTAADDYPGRIFSWW